MTLEHHVSEAAQNHLKMPTRIFLPSLNFSSKFLIQAQRPLQQRLSLSSLRPLTSANMSTASGITPQDISETARAEGGTTKGSMSAQMQSQYTKELNANGGASQVSVPAALALLSPLLHFSLHSC